MFSLVMHSFPNIMPTRLLTLWLIMPPKSWMWNSITFMAFYRWSLQGWETKVIQWHVSLFSALLNISTRMNDDILVAALKCKKESAFLFLQEVGEENQLWVNTGDKAPTKKNHQPVLQAFQPVDRLRWHIPVLTSSHSSPNLLGRRNNSVYALDAESSV